MNILENICIFGLQTNPSSTLLKKLNSIKKPIFDTDDRIIFSCFGNVEKEVLYHIEWCIYYLDIPTFFIICNTDQANVVDFFTNMADDIKIINDKQLYKSIESNASPLFFNTTMCTHAWSGIHVWPDGTTSLCCESTSKIGSYNVKNDSLSDIFYSKEMDDLRQTFRDGKTPEQCSTCIKKELQGKPSKRNITLHKHRNIIHKIDFETSGKLMFLGGHLGNLCNAKCRICNSFFSSSIAAEDIKYGTQLEKDKAKLNLQSNVWKNFDFWEHIKEYEDLCNFEFLGGEPWIQENNIKYMEWLVKTGKSKDCAFDVTTNGSTLPDVIEKLSDEFYNFSVTVSIDNLYERFELERKGVYWKDLEKNLKTLCSLLNVDVGVNTTVSILNVYYLPEIYDWLQKTGISYYHFNVLTTPDYLSITSLPVEYKQAIIERLEHLDIPELNIILDTVRKSSTVNITQFVDYMKFKDKIRNENFAETHPEIAKYYYKD